MKSVLHIFIDISGSMNEMGKAHLLRNLCRFISQLHIIDKSKFSPIGMRYFQWSTDVVELTIQDNGDIPAISAKGVSNLNSLSDFISGILEEGQIIRALILSDGNHSNPDISSFKSKLGSYSNLFLRSVAVGSDSDLLKLKKMSTNESVYLPENISNAIDSVCFGTDNIVIDPESINQIKFSQPADPEEGWDV